jgi:D-threo-aldose 1-dehydrogenase
VNAYGDSGLGLRTLGSTGLQVTPLCVGASPLGNAGMPYRYEVSEEDAYATIGRTLDGPINYLDTSNNYGDSERRIGHVLRERGGIPDGFVLQTKVDRDMDTGDFSGERMRRSVEESLERLGLDRLGMVFLHDPENTTFEAAVAPDGPLEAMKAMKAEGLIAHLGVAGGPIDLMRQFVRTGEFEAVITHNRYTLIDQSALPLFDDAEEHGVAVLNAAPFGGGVLAGAERSQDYYAYRKASPEILARIDEVRSACERAGVPLPAAALQFSMREPRVVSTIVGVTQPERIEQMIEFAHTEIPPELWDELTGEAA